MSKRQINLLAWFLTLAISLLLLRAAEGQTQPCALIRRTQDGRIYRSSAKVREFARASGFPHGRPGWIVDHHCALACGGKDDPVNYVWQTKAAAHKKDLWERTPAGCRKTCNSKNWNGPPCAAGRQ